MRGSWRQQQAATASCVPAVVGSLATRSPATPCRLRPLPPSLGRWVEAAGGRVSSAEGVEVSPLVSYAGEGLEAACGGKEFPGAYDMHLQAGAEGDEVQTRRAWTRGVRAGCGGRMQAWCTSGRQSGVLAWVLAARCSSNRSPPPPPLPQGFLQLAPKSAVGKLKGGAAAAAEYSSPRPDAKAAPTGACIIASSVGGSRLHHPHA